MKFEGAILKDYAAIWKNDTSRRMVKMKNTTECEFRIVDALYGAKHSKYESVLGSLTVASEDGGIVTNVGTGFTDEERNKGVDWWKQQVGKIVTVAFESVIEDRTERVEKKLFLPVFKEARFCERDVADTTEYCIKVSNSAIKPRFKKK
jgi:ATP-dependent DNA ligase